MPFVAKSEAYLTNKPTFVPLSLCQWLSKPHLFITNEQNQKRHAVDLNSNPPLALIINFSFCS